MDPIGAFLDEDFESMSRLFSSVESDHFMAHLYGANNEYCNTFSNNGMSSSKNLSMDETHDFANSIHTNLQHFSDENSYTSGSNSPFFPTQFYENNNFLGISNQMQVTNNDILVPTNIFSDEFLVPNIPHNVMEESLFLKMEIANEKSVNDFNQVNNVSHLRGELKLKRKINMQEDGDGKDNGLSKSPKKPRVQIDAQKGKKIASRKSKKVSYNGKDEENNGMMDTKHHPISSSSEDDNSKSASQGEVNAALNSSGKIRAGRGAATDPQSLYARRRRERINERLRILQNIVPNGTKVDISTMLEEAVHYVKFLQLQIKLLSSDEMWMFAPIAYNGMDMGSLQQYFSMTVQRDTITVFPQFNGIP